VTALLLLLMYLSCAALFVAVARWADRSLVLTPFLLAGVTTMVSTWPAALAETDPTVDPMPALLAAGCSVALFIGFVVVAANVGLRPNEGTRFRDGAIVDQVVTNRYRRGVWIVSAMLVALGTILYRGLPPILDSIKAVLSPSPGAGAVIDINVTRNLITKGHIFGIEAYRGQGVLRVILERGWIYVSVLSIATSFLVAQRRRALSVRTFLQPAVVILLGLVYVGGVGVRAPVIMLVAGVVVGLSMLRRLSVWAMSVAALVLVATILFVAPLGGELRSRGSLTERLDSMSERLFLGNGRNDILIMRLSRDGTLPRQWGRVHVEQLLQAVPGVSGIQPFSSRLNELRPGDRSDTAYASSTYLGVLYVDFGPLGALAGFGAIGGAIAYSHHFLFRRRKTVPNVALVTSLVIVLSQFTVVGFVGVGVGVGVVAVLHLLTDRFIVLRYARRSIPRAPQPWREPLRSA
jgi:hypothetical protein